MNFNFIKNLISKSDYETIDNAEDNDFICDEGKDYSSMFKKDIDLVTLKKRDKSREHLCFPE